MIGKAFGHRSSKHDNFFTPYSMTEQLLENEKFDYNKNCDEPAKGNDAIVKVIDKYFQYRTSNDIKLGRDFLEVNYKSDYIITNPPFSLWDEFVKKAKQVAIEKFAFLGRLEFLTGLKRYNENLYYDPEYPLTKIYLFVRKVNLSFSDNYPELREDGKYPCGMYHYAWFIFEKNYKFGNGIRIFNDKQIPIIKMINNNKYILRAKDVN